MTAIFGSTCNLYAGGSGAAVVDTQSKLIGIASGVLSRIAPLAIPASTVDRVVRELLLRGRMSRAWLGVAVQTVVIPSTLAEAANSPSHGLIVLSADPETPAGKAGILVGDILLNIGGTAVRDPMDLRAALASHAAGEKVAVSLVRGGEPKQIEVTLGERAARSRMSMAAAAFEPALGRVTEELRRCTIQVLDGNETGGGTGVVRGRAVTDAHVVARPKLGFACGVERLRGHRLTEWICGAILRSWACLKTTALTLFYATRNPCGRASWRWQ